jgi:hypothetical protein
MKPYFTELKILWPAMSVTVQLRSGGTKRGL